jgi:SAM-dependent methyltransferase
MTANDFVFRQHGGRLEFRGDFEGLYRAEDDPWGQSGAGGPMASYYEASRQTLCGVLGWRLADSGIARPRGLEVGCGNGWVLSWLQREVGGHWDGMDISAAACANARERNPGCPIHLGDIAGDMPFPPNALARYDVVILSQVLWYILHRIDHAVDNAARLTRRGGFLVVSQAYLRGEQRYGARIADGWRGALALFLRAFPHLELVAAHYDATTRHAHHDGLMIFRKVAHGE